MSGHLRREVVQPVDGAAERAIGQEAEHARHDDRVLQPAGGDVRLPDDGQLRVGSAVEEPLHRGERHRLVLRHDLPLAVPGRERDQNAGRQPRHDPRTQADRRVTGVAAHQAPIGPDGGPATNSTSSGPIPRPMLISAQPCMATRWGTTHTLGVPVVPLVSDSRNGTFSSGSASSAIPDPGAPALARTSS